MPKNKKKSYGLSIWGNYIRERYCNKILLEQKRCIRLICDSKYNAHTDPLFKKLTIPKFKKTVQCYILCDVFKATKNLLPKSLCLNFQRSNNVYNTRNILNPIRCKTNHCKRSIYNYGVTEFNKLSPTIKAKNNVSQFKSCIKKIL